jgi:hypothetical protein
MNNKTILYKKLGAWSGVSFFVLFSVACVALARFVPPPSPMLTGEEILATYASNTGGIGSAVVVAYFAACFLIPWSAIVSSEMARIEGGPWPIISVSAFGAGVANAVAFFLPFVFWAAAIYRMDRPPELVRLMSDMAWLEFVMLYVPYAMQVIAIAIVGLGDKSATPTFPRWFCFLSFWIALGAVPGGIVIFFKTGPFTWNGAFGFWLPVAAFVVYWGCLVPLIFKSIKRQELALQASA